MENTRFSHENLRFARETQNFASFLLLQLLWKRFSVVFLAFCEVEARVFKEKPRFQLLKPLSFDEFIEKLELREQNRQVPVVKADDFLDIFQRIVRLKARIFQVLWETREFLEKSRENRVVRQRSNAFRVVLQAFLNEKLVKKGLFVEGAQISLDFQDHFQENGDFFKRIVREIEGIEVIRVEILEILVAFEEFL